MIAAVLTSLLALTGGPKIDNPYWPMTPRAHPGATPANNTVPITYFGSAWGTLGLMRLFPK